MTTTKVHHFLKAWFNTSNLKKPLSKFVMSLEGYWKSLKIFNNNKSRTLSHMKPFSISRTELSFVVRKLLSYGYICAKFKLMTSVGIN